MGRKPTEIQYYFDTQTLRWKVGSRIKEVRKELGINQRDVARDLNIDHVTLSKLENGKSELKLEYIYRLSEYFLKKSNGRNGSMSYLIGELDEYRTFTEKALCEQTGLNREALYIMKNENATKHDSPASNTFLKLINRIIYDFYPHKSGKVFPINKIVGYINSIEDNKTIQLHPMFDDIIQFIREYEKRNKYAPRYNEIKDELTSMGYSEDEISALTRIDYSRIKNFDTFQNKEKRNMRIDIQDLFSEFMRSDFIEGKENGKE